VRLVDANLLLYAVNEDAPAHRKARSWLEGMLSGSETLAFTWTALLAFLRISTHPGIFPRPLEPREAFTLLESWLAQPCVTVLEPGAKHLTLLRKLLLPLGTAGNLTSDAHFAAVAVEHGAEICSSDADFARFPGLRWSNPLA
jgi:toxin-antitoxin system PIN domain toxin